MNHRKLSAIEKLRESRYCTPQRGELKMDTQQKLTEEELDNMSAALSSSGIVWGERLIGTIRTQEQEIERLRKIEKDAIEGAAALEAEQQEDD